VPHTYCGHYAVVPGPCVCLDGSSTRCNLTAVGAGVATHTSASSYTIHSPSFHLDSTHARMRAGPTARGAARCCTPLPLSFSRAAEPSLGLRLHAAHRGSRTFVLVTRGATYGSARRIHARLALPRTSIFCQALPPLPCAPQPTAARRPDLTPSPARTLALPVRELDRLPP